MPVYNSESYVEASVRSIFNQTYTNFELLIIDDGSTDDTPNILKRLATLDHRIRLTRNTENKGLIFTLNKGLKDARGNYVARMDADDVALPERLLVQKKYLDSHANCVVVGSSYRIFGDQELEVEMSTLNSELKTIMYFENPLAHPTVMFRKSVVLVNNLQFQERLLYMEDWGLWFELSNYGELSNINTCLLEYRMEGQNITVKNRETARDRTIKYYKEILPDIYKEYNDLIPNYHWIISRSAIEGCSMKELINAFDFVEQNIAIPNLPVKHLAKYLRSKKIKMFHVLADQSFRKGLIFLFQKEVFSLKRALYLLKSKIT